MSTLNKIRARFKFVEDWQLDAKVTKAIQHLSFFQISTISGCKFNPRLVAAFCNLYHESDDVFEIGQHKLGISLEDVFMFTGLPVDGMPLVIAESLEPLEVCKHLLGWDRVGIDAVKPGSINLKRLQEKFMVVPTEVEDHSQELKYYVRAYLLALIGSILLPRSTEQIVPVSYLLFIDDIDRVDDYAWGAGLLAQLNSGIRKFRNEPRKCAYGAFWLIQMFIMEHFPSLAKKIMLDHSNTLPTRLPKRIPLVVEWSKLLKGPSMQSLKNTNFAEMLAAPNLEFISRPYERIEGIVRSRLFYSRTLLIGLNYLAYHRPDLFPDQLGIGEVDMSDLRKIIRFKEKIRTGDSGKNWPRNYKQYINEWKFRYQSCVKDCSEGTDFNAVREVYQGSSSPITQDDDRVVQTSNSSLHKVIDGDSILNAESSVPRSSEPEIVHHPYKRGGSSQRRKRGRPWKLVTIRTMGSEAVAGTKDHGIQDVSNETVERAQPANEVEFLLQTTVESTEDAARVSETDCFTPDDMAVTPASETLLDDDQPLSMWTEGMHSSATADELVSGRNSSGLDETNGRNVDMAMVPCVKKARGVKTPDENECVPFVKRSLVWNTIESMEIFQMIPQKPHFRPLADCKEEYREGSAIGIMVTFASLFEKIASLQFDGSESILTSTLESLVDLEKHGFDVAILRNRVKDLLSITDGKEELLNQSKDIERQIREHTDERGQLVSKINDTEKKIIELQLELAPFKSEMKTKENVIARLQSDVDSMKGRMNTDRDNFAKLASAPWVFL